MITRKEKDRDDNVYRLLLSRTISECILENHIPFEIAYEVLIVKELMVEKSLRNVSKITSERLLRIREKAFADMDEVTSRVEDRYDIYHQHDHHHDEES